MTRYLTGVVLGAVLLAGCGTASPEQPATATPTPSAYTWGTVVDQHAYVGLLAMVGGDHGDADQMAYTVCTSTLTPQELIDGTTGTTAYVRMAVLAACPDRKDW